MANSYGSYMYSLDGGATFKSIYGAQSLLQESVTERQAFSSVLGVNNDELLFVVPPNILSPLSTVTTAYSENRGQTWNYYNTETPLNNFIHYCFYAFGFWFVMHSKKENLRAGLDPLVLSVSGDKGQTFTQLAAYNQVFSAPLLFKDHFLVLETFASNENWGITRFDNTLAKTKTLNFGSVSVEPHGLYYFENNGCFLYATDTTIGNRKNYIIRTNENGMEQSRALIDYAFQDISFGHYADGFYYLQKGSYLYKSDGSAPFYRASSYVDYNYFLQEKGRAS